VTDYERLGGSHQDDECAAEEWRKPRWWNRVHPGGAFPIVAGLAADRLVRGVPGSGLGHGSRGQGVVPGTRCRGCAEEAMGISKVGIIGDTVWYTWYTS